MADRTFLRTKKLTGATEMTFRGINMHMNLPISCFEYLSLNFSLQNVKGGNFIKLSLNFSFLYCHMCSIKISGMT